MQEYTAGQKIQFMLPDKKGKKHWFPGLIHGVKHYEDAATNLVTKVTYLVDIGRDDRVDEHPINIRDTEVNNRFNKAFKEHPDPVKNQERRLELTQKILSQPDLPDNKIEIVKVRQPEQIELPAEFIRPRK